MDALFSIGELARRTGLTVGTVRFYSDRGLVAPAERSPAGYRRYSADALARLTLVRTLRDLGLDLDSIRQVADRHLTLRDVAAAHADAMAVQIRVLQLRHAVLTALAHHPQEEELVEHVTRHAENERRRLVDEFLGTVFADLDRTHAGIRCSMTPELPTDASPEQVQAWNNLIELTLDPEFRATMRQIVENHAVDADLVNAGPPQPDIAAYVRDLVDDALTAGVDPASADADPILTAITALYAEQLGSPDDNDLRRRLRVRLENISDPRRDRYLELLAVVNGWLPPQPLTPALDWTVRALRARTEPTAQVAH